MRFRLSESKIYTRVHKAIFYGHYFVYIYNFPLYALHVQPTLNTVPRGQNDDSLNVYNVIEITNSSFKKWLKLSILETKQQKQNYMHGKITSRLYARIICCHPLENISL